MVATVTMRETSVVVDAVLDAPLDAVWRVLATPALHPATDTTDMLRGARSPRRIEALGEEFTMDMQRGPEGEHYVVVNTVSDFVPGRSIGWIVNTPDERLGWGWRYDLERVGRAGNRTRTQLTYHWGDADPEALASIGQPMPAIPPALLIRSLELLEVEAALAPAPDDEDDAEPDPASSAGRDRLEPAEALEMAGPADPFAPVTTFPPTDLRVPAEPTPAPARIPTRAPTPRAFRSS